MSTARNPMVVTAILRLRGRLPLEELRALVTERAFALPRLRARVEVPRLGAPHWVEQNDLRAEDHAVARAPVQDERALARSIDAIVAEPLPAARPLWRLSAIDEPEGTTIVAQIHHALADGNALLGVLFALSDEGAGFQPPPTAPLRASFSASSWLHRLASARKTARPAPLARPLGGHKRLAWTGPLPLRALRDRAHAAEARVNDVLLASIAGAVREHLLVRSARPTAPLLALVPIALPHAGGAGNHFTSAFVPLPVHLDDPSARLASAREAMRVARARAGVGLGRVLLLGTSLTSAIGGRIGGFLERAGVLVASRGVTLVASDLVGPPSELHLGGRPIRSVLFASPVPGSVPIAISAFGYAGHVGVTVAVDDAVVGDPWELCEQLELQLR